MILALDANYGSVQPKYFLDFNPVFGLPCFGYSSMNCMKILLKVNNCVYGLVSSWWVCVWRGVQQRHTQPFLMEFARFLAYFLGLLKCRMLTKCNFFDNTHCFFLLIYSIVVFFFEFCTENCKNEETYVSWYDICNMHSTKCYY